MCSFGAPRKKLVLLGRIRCGIFLTLVGDPCANQQKEQLSAWCNCRNGPCAQNRRSFSLFGRKTFKCSHQGKSTRAIVNLIVVTWFWSWSRVRTNVRRKKGSYSEAAVISFPSRFSAFTRARSTLSKSGQTESEPYFLLPLYRSFNRRKNNQKYSRKIKKELSWCELGRHTSYVFAEGTQKRCVHIRCDKRNRARRDARQTRQNTLKKQTNKFNFFPQGASRNGALNTATFTRAPVNVHEYIRNLSASKEITEGSNICLATGAAVTKPIHF